MERFVLGWVLKLCLVEILKMKFDQDLCLNLWYNSTLGSVVPLAMFHLRGRKKNWAYIMPNCQGRLERYMNGQWSCRAKCWVTDWMDWIPFRLSWLLKMLNMMKNENVLLVPHSWAWWGKVFFSSEAFPKISDLLALSCIRWASVNSQGRQHVLFSFLFLTTCWSS